MNDSRVMACSDGEFRLLVGLLGLAARSPRPGWVFAVEGVGLAPADLTRVAGVRDGGSPEAMLGHLEQLQLVRRHPGGVLEILWGRFARPARGERDGAAIGPVRLRRRRSRG